MAAKKKRAPVGGVKGRDAAEKERAELVKNAYPTIPESQLSPAERKRLAEIRRRNSGK